MEEELKLVAALNKAIRATGDDWGLAPARFALYPTDQNDLAATAQRIRSVLSQFNPRVEENASVIAYLTLTLPGHTMGPAPGPAYDAAYAFVDTFKLRSAEPELYTNLWPELDEDPDTESIDALKETCRAPEDPTLDSQWALDAIGARQAWDYSAQKGRPTHGRGIIIAQPDTGVTKHDELVEVQYVAPYDLIADKSGANDPLDYLGNPSHGTGTASVVVSGRGGKILGSAPLASHMPIRAIESVVRISQLRVAEAIDYAIDKGAHVITMSLGGLPSLALWSALKRAIDNNLIVLAAAGNCVKLVVWPARYDDCIAVAGVNIDDQPWRGSSRGGRVDISAPGENVYRAKAKLVGENIEYCVEQGQGTSFAAALTAGVAALWLAHHGRQTIIDAARARNESVQAMFRRLLRHTARPPVEGEWDDTTMGAGIVDAAKLLAASFDDGRGAESNAAEAQSHSDAIRGLVREASGGVAAAELPAPDIYGVEVTHALLAAQRECSAAPGQMLESARAVAGEAVLSERLRGAIGKDSKLAAMLHVGQ